MAELSSSPERAGVSAGDEHDRDRRTSGDLVSDFDAVDFFSDQSLVPDPYPYFDYLRSKCPVSRESRYGVMAVTGHKEACTVYKEGAFSACVSVAGPFAGVSFDSDTDDIGALIEAHRDQI